LIEHFNGGGLVANGSSLDAYRLGMQYGLSDAIIMSSNNVSADGVDNKHRKGYLCLAYGPCQWPHVAAIDEHLEEKFLRQRGLWHQLGYLSSRKYPAQIVISYSGLKYGDSPDFLAGRIFHDCHPNGESIECYIVTSELGAQRILERSHAFNLQDRIERMLIVLPPPCDSSTARPNTELDLTLLPSILYEKYDMKIVDHDGGQKVFNAFSKAGIMSQLNLSLGRQQTLQQIITSKAATTPALRDYLTAHENQEESGVEDKFQYFFGNENKDKRDKTQYYRGIPKDLSLVSFIEDTGNDQVAIAVFDISKGFDFDK